VSSDRFLRKTRPFVTSVPGSAGSKTGQQRLNPLPVFREDDRVGAIATITATTNQKSVGWSKSPTLKFMPITPAISAPGSRITEVSVSTFMISFVR
jgi:hypothetical protein